MADKICDKPAAYRYTWPGRDESIICEEHSHRLINVADALGFHLQLIPVDSGTCAQKVKS